jgi:hypothetical protein
MRSLIGSFATGLLIVTLPIALEARQPAGSPPGRGQVGQRPPDLPLPPLPKQIETVTGKVSEVIRRTRRGPIKAMVDVRLTFDRKEILVRLAPIGFLKEKKFVVKEGDVLSVSGYRMTTIEGKFLVGIEVRRGSQTLRLRHSPGRPVWKKGTQ